jgi:hypothetical protein
MEEERRESSALRNHAFEVKLELEYDDEIL